MASSEPVVDSDFEQDHVVYKLRDFNSQMVKAWEEAFEKYIPDRIQVSLGDIFNGAPAADAIVSPANSFGFMDGGIDMAYSMHFGWQMQKRLQKVIREEHNGELLVGNAIIIPAYDEQHIPKEDMSDYNEGQLIKYLISAPTMRVPLDVSTTVNAYLAFRAIILAVHNHNKKAAGTDKIRSVLCPGLGTAVGLMPKVRCANQMLQAFETYELGQHNKRICPEHLIIVSDDHEDMSLFGQTRDYNKKELERIESLPDPPRD